MGKNKLPLQSEATMEYDRVFERLIPVGLLMLAIAFALFMQFALAAVLLVLGLLCGIRISIRDPKTGRSWSVPRQNWQHYCEYNQIGHSLKQQMNVSAIAAAIKQR
ncbi:hypothetical protein [Limosilactobacillus mucosae]|uniref:hypothetical protein n=1 Tax=Limosilactobacillus mucosae TaxID=97478 RepID=UPI0025A44F7A|nr:hypothetical protein [Limosilactobacillus mucosae]MDM8220138.1 hypothetical protein [Limosilactobacillus mucosae]MDM8314794.1 hypothetical protein [Limosilactobacillus mucosae]